MAKKVKKTDVCQAPDHLTMNLFAPGMSALHRAGLGGLACTLKAMERQYEGGLLREDKLPAPVEEDRFPWEIDDRTITLKFGKPENAAKYLEKLFAFAFQIRDGLIYLPGQYPDPPPSLAVRAELQTALTRTLLQGAKKNIGLEARIPYLVNPDGDGSSQIEIEFQKCNWYLHQKGWLALVDDETDVLRELPGKLEKKGLNFGSLYPGAIKRHDAIAESEISDSVSGILCSLFFLVGCASARLATSGDGILLTPDVVDLENFVFDRAAMTPRTVSEVRVGGAADAAYQAEVRLRFRSLLKVSSIASCFAQRFSLRTWTKPQKSRVDGLELSMESVGRQEPENRSSDELDISRFELAWACLPGKVGQGKEDSHGFLVESAIRPQVATNLTARHPWHHQFISLADTPSKRRKLSYERKGLNDMIQNQEMLTGEQETVVRAVQQALGSLYGKISKDYEDRPQLMGNKFSAEQEKWGRIFSGSMTLDQFRRNLSEMFRRAGTNVELQKNWQLLLPLLHKGTWRQARDLALIGLCSYSTTKKQSQVSTNESA